MRGILAIRHRQTNRVLPRSYDRTQRSTNRNRHDSAFSHRPKANQVNYQRHANLRIRTSLLLNGDQMFVVAYPDYCRRSDSAYSLVSPEQLPAPRRCEHPPLTEHPLPREGQPVLLADDTITDQTDERATTQELASKVPTYHAYMPLR
jgi:hypothetical protein